MENKYTKMRDAGLQGVQFQLNLLAVFLLNALRSLKDWKISSETVQAEKFDDVVLEMPDKSVLLQAKFKHNGKVRKSQLLSPNSKQADFSLPKYFFAYLKVKSIFPKATVVICTNTGIENGLENFLTRHRVFPDHILYYEDETSFFTFNDNIVAELKVSAEQYFDKHLNNEQINKAEITIQNIKEFLKNLHFFYNYPCGAELHNIIEQLLFRLNSFNLYKKVSFQDINRKIEEWFTNRRAGCLTEEHANAMFGEIKSDKFCEELKNYNVTFRHNELNFTDSKQIFIISSTGRYLLDALKIYDVLQKDKRKKLYISPYDTLEVRKQVIEAFAYPQYVLLIIVGFNITDTIEAKQIYDKLKTVLNERDYKKVILVADCSDKLSQQFKSWNTRPIDGCVKFEDLSDECQRKLVTKKNIEFQGRQISLEELIAPNTNEVWAEIVNSEILDGLIKNSKIEVGVCPTDSDKSNTRYYIPRTFKRQIYKNKEEQINTDLPKKQYLNTMPTSKLDDNYNGDMEDEIFPEETIYDLNERVVLIADSAGMGKTTTLAKLAITIKDKYPHLWVIRMEFSNYTAILKQRLTDKVESVNIKDLLKTKLKNSVENFVFSMDKKVVLLLDGIDEVSPDYTNLILNCLTQCIQANNFAKLFVTTRPYIVQQLEGVLGAKPFILQPLTEQNQVDFLTNFWSYNLTLPSEDEARCEMYAKSLINKMTSWTWTRNDFTAIPLQLRMLAEIFQEDIESSDWECCNEFLKHTKSEPKLPENMEITKVYEMFIEKKRNVYVIKGSPRGKTETQKALIDRFDKLLTRNKRLALEIILHKDDCQLFSSDENDHEDNESLLKTGFIQISNNELDFIHRTIAEYFVAESIIREIKLQSYRPDLKFQQFLINKIFQLSEYKVIRIFFDSFLQSIKSHIPNDIFDDYKFKISYLLHSGNDYNLIHLLAGEGCVELLQLILKSLNFGIIRNRIVNTADIRNRFFGKKINALPSSKRKTGAHLKSKKGNILKVIQYYIREGGINIKDNDDRTPLHKAAENGHFEMVRFLVKHGAILDNVDQEGDTALHFAALVGRLNIIMYLVSRGADVNIVDKASCTALHFAAAKRHLDVAEYLAESGSIANIKDNGWKTALHIAAENGNLYTVKLLLEKGVDVNVGDANGVTALNIAAAKERLDVIEYLVESGGDINVKDAIGRTALHFAAGHGVLHMVKYLLRRGADVGIQDDAGVTALHLATEKDDIDTMKTLLERGVDPDIQDCRGRTALHFAAANDNCETVEILLQMRADVHVKDVRGSTPLHLAVTSGELLATQFLFAWGADGNIGDFRGRTALHVAVENDNSDAVKFFLQKGVEVNIRDNRRITPLYLAVDINQLHTTKFLVNGGAEVNAADDRATTPLHLSAAKGSENTTKLLLDSGADIDVPDVEGRTPLHLAVTNDHLKTTEILVRRGSDTSIGDVTGKTALHLSAAKGYLNTTKFLLDSGAKIDVLDVKGRTPLHLAVMNDHLDTTEFLVRRGSDASIEDITGKTALHSAAAIGKLDIAKFLPRTQDYINKKDINGSTALHFAVANQHHHFVKFLLQLGVDVNVKNDAGVTPLHFAAGVSYSYTVQLLLKNDADPYAKDVRGRTALHSAAESGYLDSVQLICQRYVNDQDVGSGTALHLAAEDGYLDSVNLPHQRYVNDQDVGYRTALHLAAAKGHLSTVGFLLSHGANINAKEVKGNTPLHFAAAHGHLDTVKYLLKMGADVSIRNSYGNTARQQAFKKYCFLIFNCFEGVERDATIND